MRKCHSSRYSSGERPTLTAPRLAEAGRGIWLWSSQDLHEECAPVSVWLKSAQKVAKWALPVCGSSWKQASVIFLIFKLMLILPIWISCFSLLHALTRRKTPNLPASPRGIRCWIQPGKPTFMRTKGKICWTKNTGIAPSRSPSEHLSHS